MRKHRAWSALSALAGATACGGVAEGPGAVVETQTFAQTYSLPGDFDTLQDALDITQRNDVVELAAGEFTARTTVQTLNLTLRGAGIGRTILRGGLNVRRAGLRLEDMTIEADGDAFGLHARGFSVIASRVEVTGFSFGVSVFDSDRPTQLNEVVLRANQNGLYVNNSNVTSVNGLFLHNTKAGVFARSGARLRVYHGTFVGNGFSNPGDASGAVVLGPGGFQDVRNNVMVGNQYGVQCTGCGSRPGNNLVWGNVEDYTGEAGRGQGDISADPLFVDPGSGDFRLRAGSPAIDAGVAVGTIRDAGGGARPAGLGPDLGAYEWQPPVARVVINEVLANALDERTGEFVELLNLGDGPVDLAGWWIDDLDGRDPLQALRRGGSTVIEPGGYGVILDPDYPDVAALPPGATLLTVDDTSISNGLSTGDPVLLRLPDGNTIVSAYEEPFDPGDGISAERTSPDAGTFAPSPCGSSPGRANCIGAPVEPPPDGEPQVLLLITEVMANPVDERRGEYVELMNLGEDAVDLAGWTLSDGDSSDVLQGFEGGSTTLAGGGGFAVILDPDHDGDPVVPPGVTLLTGGDRRLGNGLSTDDPVTLRDPAGVLVAAFVSPFDPGNGTSAELGSLDGGAWQAAPCGASPGATNCAWEDDGVGPGPLTLAITEVMANPLDEDTGEFVEIVNTGDEDVDLADVRLSDGDAVDSIVPMVQGRTTLLAPGAVALILDPEYAGEYGLPAGVQLFRPDDTTLGSGIAVNDPVTLIAGGEEIAGFLAPFNPGNGRSAEWDGRAWVPSTCASGASPGRHNCSAPPLPEEVVLPRVRISEVMANPLTERSGEFVEVVSFDDAAVIDLADWVLFDGDSTDVLLPWPGPGGGTRIGPGRYGVILDPDFDGDYDLPAEAVLMTTGDRSLGNGLATSDPVSLLLPDGVTVVSSWVAPFNPGNGRSASGANPAEFVATDCGPDVLVHASPGQAECPQAGDGPDPDPGPEEDPLACLAAEECEAGWRCMGFPADGSGAHGRCADVRRDYPGEYGRCASHADCEAGGMVCAGMTVFPGASFCIAQYHHGVYSSASRVAIPDGDDAGVTSEIVVYGLATVPLDITVTAAVDHPDRSQLRLTLRDPRGDRAVVFDGGAHEPGRLDGPMIALGNIPRDDYVNGRWTLEVVDTAAGSAGSLNGWGVEIVSNWD